MELLVENEWETLLSRLLEKTIGCAMKELAIALLSLAVATGSMVAADTKKTAVPGTDDMSRYVSVKAIPGEPNTLQDASGRTLGTARTVGTRTTFRDSTGRMTGIATTDGNKTIFHDASGRTVGTATTSNGQTSFRDASGVCTVNHFSEPRHDVGPTMLTQFHHDPAPTHLLGHCAGCARASKGVKDPVTWVRSDVNDSMKQALRLGS